MTEKDAHLSSAGREAREAARHCEELARQLAGLKQVAYSTLDVADADSLALVLSKQVRKCLGARNNAVWLTDSEGSMVKRAANGRLTEERERELCSPAEVETQAREAMNDPALFPLDSPSGRLGLISAEGVGLADREILEFLAEFTARNLDLARRHEAADRKLRGLSERIEILAAQNDQLTTMHHLGVKAMAAATPEALCGVVLDALVSDFAAKGAAVFLLASPGGRLHCLKAVESLGGLAGIMTVPGDIPAIKAAMDLRRIITYRDSAYPARLEIGSNTIPEWNVYPLKGREDMIGLMVIHGPTVWENDAVANLALFCAMAMDNLLLLDERKKTNSLLARKTNELAEAMAAAKIAARAKSDFLANMSHEIRTPINAIIGVTELLSESCEDPGQEHYLGILKSAGDSLLALINDILDLSKIEAGKESVENTEFNLRLLVEKTSQVLAFNAHKKGLEFICAISPRTPDTVVSDPTKLRQILVNLLGNAVKFTPAGQVMLSLDAEPAGQGEARLVFVIRDTGIGIPADKLESVFFSFTQAQASTTREYGGTGLGLTICRSMARMLGGDVTAQSTVGQGSAFRLFVPVRVPEGAWPDQDAAMRELAGARVLVVDDNPDMRALLRDQFNAWGAECATAGDRAEALDTARRTGADSGVPDLVLVDSGLEGGKGLELAGELLGLGLAKRAVMLLTTDMNPAEYLERTPVPVSGCLTKPMAASDLRLAAVSLLRNRRSPVEDDRQDHEAGPQSWKRARVLLVEDSDNNRLLIQAYLKKMPMALSVAKNGREALDAFTPGGFDLVLMDIQMPVMDGLEATTAIRALEKEKGLRPTPIIALTAHATTQDRDKCLGAGATDYLTKPVRKKELLQAIRAQLEPGG